MNRVSFIVPESTTNLVSNPSLETGTTGYTAIGSALARVLTQQYFGAYSLEVTPTAGTGDGVYYAITLTAATTYTISAYVLAALGIPMLLELYDVTGAVVIAGSAFYGTGAWNRVVLTQATGANTSHRVRIIKNNSASVAPFYVDGVQVEQKAYVTTYVDGSQSDGVWTGTAHASTSIRSAQERGGGRIVQIEDYDMVVEEFRGLGMPPQTHNVQPLATLPGARLQSVKIDPRVVDLKIRTNTDTEAELYAAKDGLIAALTNELFNDLQPVTMIYSGNNQTIRLYCNYDSGLEWGNHPRKMRYDEFTLRLIAYDPLIYAEANHLAALSALTPTTAVEYIAAQIDGAWSGLGPPAVTGPASVRAIEMGADGTIYVGGDFTNWNGIANADYIVMYQNGVWQAMGTGANGPVYGIEVLTNGEVWAVGNFTSMGGVTTYGVAKWSASAWSVVMSIAPTSGYPMCIKQALNGYIYIGGSFLNFAGLAAADYIAVIGYYPAYPTLAYAALLNCQPNGNVNALASEASGTILIGGAFTSVSGTTIYDFIIRYTPSTAVVSRFATSGSTNGAIYAIAVGLDGSVYVGGLFTSIASAPAHRVAKWALQTFGPVTLYYWLEIDSGIDPSLGLGTGVYTLSVLANGQIIAGGDFTAAGAVSVDRVALWTGTIWSSTGVDLPGSVTVFSSLPDGNDYYLGFNTEGNLVYSGGYGATVTYGGKAATYPKIIISTSGGTASLTSIQNVTLGLSLNFSLLLQDGETLTIDLTPLNKRIASNLRGNLITFLMRGSAYSKFRLIKGDNVIVVNITGAGTITARLEWQNTYESVDQAR